MDTPDMIEPLNDAQKNKAQCAEISIDPRERSVLTMRPQKAIPPEKNKEK